MTENILKTIFSRPRYLASTCGIFATMLFLLLLVSEYVFLSPYLVGHIPRGTEIGLSLIVIISILSSLVIPMNIYRISMLKKSRAKIGGSVLGSIIGASAGACSCGPIGFAMVSTLGTVGSVTSSFLTNYDVPIRIVAIGVLVLTLYTTTKSISNECRLVQ